MKRKSIILGIIAGSFIFISSSFALMDDWKVSTKNNEVTTREEIIIEKQITQKTSVKELMDQKDRLEDEMLNIYDKILPGYRKQIEVIDKMVKEIEEETKEMKFKKVEEVIPGVTGEEKTKIPVEAIKKDKSNK